jgi:hypothetical protein
VENYEKEPQNRRHHFRRKDDRETSYEIMSYKLECDNEDLKKISNEISSINQKIMITYGSIKHDASKPKSWF